MTERIDDTDICGVCNQRHAGECEQAAERYEARREVYAKALLDAAGPTHLAIGFRDTLAEAVMAVADAEAVHRIAEIDSVVQTEWRKRAEKAEAEVERLRISPDRIEEMLGIDPNDPLQKFAEEIVRLDEKVEKAEAEVERLHSWQGLLSLLDEHWPEETFPTLTDDANRDTGPRLTSALRRADDAWLWKERTERAVSRLFAIDKIHVAFGDEGSIRCADDGWTWPCPTNRAIHQ